MQITKLIVNGKVLYTNSPDAAKDISASVESGEGVPNMPGGPITDIDQLMNNLANNYEDNVKFEWRDAPKKGTVIVRPSQVPVGFDIAPYQELKALSSSDQANVILYVYLMQLKSMIMEGGSAGTLIHEFQSMTNSLGMVINAKTQINGRLMDDRHVALAKKLELDYCVTHLQRKTVQYKVVSTYQALIEFAAHEGTTVYYLHTGNYLLEIAEATMEISSSGHVVRVDGNFDDELLKVGYKIIRFNAEEARAVLTLSKVLHVSKEGDDYKVQFSTTLPGDRKASYPGFAEYSLLIGGEMKNKLNPIIRGKGKIIPEAGWTTNSAPVFALWKFFKEHLEGDMEYIEVIERFLDRICTVDAQKLYLSLCDLQNSRRDAEKDLKAFLSNPVKCVEFCKKASSCLSVFGVSGSGVLPYTENGVSKVLKYPTFEENTERLKAGRFSRNDDPRKFLNKQYPVTEGGAPEIMGAATAGKWEMILATLNMLHGSGFLSQFSNFLYAGVTNNDRMLGGVCKAWCESRPDRTLSNLVLLDRNSPNPSTWGLKYGDHKFTLRSSQNPAGDFVSMDLITYMDNMDVSGEKTSFLFSDCNILSTDDENYLEKNDFAAEGIELGYEKITSWIVNLKGATSNFTSAAKYIFKCVSKFKAGAIKLHLLKINPGTMEALGQKLYQVAGVDSFLWKEGRGHNAEFYFYWFPPTGEVLHKGDPDRERPLLYHICMTWLYPLICYSNGLSELTRHVAFYCPNKVEGEAKIAEGGLLSHSPSFPIIFPRSLVRKYVPVEVNGYRYKAIKNMRLGNQVLVAGIATGVEGTLNLDKFYVGAPPTPKEEPKSSYLMDPPPVEKRVIQPIKKQVQPPKEEIPASDPDFDVDQLPTVGLLDLTTGSHPVSHSRVSNHPIIVDDEEEEDEETKKSKRKKSAFDTL